MSMRNAYGMRRVPCSDTHGVTRVCVYCKGSYGGTETLTVLSDVCVRQVELSLKYYQDVVQKGILEMLPGSTTAVLETVVHLHMVLMNRLGGETR